MDIHPLEKFKYCPKCGSKHFDVHNQKSKLCDNCGFVYYANPSVAVAAFIVNSHGEILVVRRGKEPAKGTLDLPGGFADFDETIEDAIVREVREETGLKVLLAKYMFSLPNIYFYSGMEIHTLDMFLLCNVAQEDMPKAGDDAAECLFIPLKDVHTEQFGLRSIRHALRLFLQEKLDSQ